ASNVGKLFSQDRIVLNNQKVRLTVSQLLPVISHTDGCRTVTLGVGLSRSARWVSLWQGTNKRRAFALLALEGQIPAQQARRFASDGGPEPRSSAVGTIRIDLLERGEDTLWIIARHTNAGVGDDKRDRL